MRGAMGGAMRSVDLYQRVCRAHLVSLTHLFFLSAQNYGMAGPVPNFVVGATPRDVPMYAPTMIMAAEPDAPVEQRENPPLFLGISPPVPVYTRATTTQYQPTRQRSAGPLRCPARATCWIQAPPPPCPSPAFAHSTRFDPGVRVCAGKEVSMAVQPPYQPQYQINMKPLYYLLALLALLVAATLVLTAVSAHTSHTLLPLLTQ